MIWLASFPRSGNTFFRNILYQVYGLESSTYHREPGYPVDEGYQNYPVVKTHLLPSELIPRDSSIPKIYLVRDGRDALVSIAHHRKDIIEPHTDYYNNLLEAILAPEGTFFGGWSENVQQWLQVADLVIRYEDLIVDPLQEAEKLRTIIDLPPARPEQLLDFKALKAGGAQYGSGRAFLKNEQRQKALATKNFRRGKAGSWQDEMPPELEQLFWELHGSTMTQLGYPRMLGSNSHPNPNPNLPHRILIEAEKFKDPQMDGVKRYLEELVSALLIFQQRQPDKWQIDFLQGGEVISIFDILQTIRAQRAAAWEQGRAISPVASFSYESRLLALKDRVKLWLPDPVYRVLSGVYRAGPFRDMLRSLRTRVAWRQLQELDTVSTEAHHLIHVPLPQNYYLVSHFEQPLVFTVHDLTHRLYPQFHEADNNKLVERGMQSLQDKKAHLIAVSEATRQDIIQTYDIPANQITVIPEAANSQWFRPVTDKDTLRRVQAQYQLPDAPFLLSLSTLEPRKNLKNTIAAFLSLLQAGHGQDAHFVVCGKRGWKLESLVEASHPFAHRIHFTGYVDEVDLPALYTLATGMAYVAHYEGFGLPPLEAMKCGTPVIYGDNSAMREVIAEAGLPAPADDVAAIAEQMRRLLSDTPLRQDYAQRALRRAHRYSWLTTAFHTLLTYERIIKSTATEL